MATFPTLLAAALLGAPALPAARDAMNVSFDSARWEIEAAESRVVDHLGRRSLFLKSGIATVKDSDFTDGIIEFDIAFAAERGFMGAVWRMRDTENYEEFYVRPHQSGNPDACQYQPVFNGQAAWQLYSGEGFTAAITFEHGQWIPVRIVVSGKSAEVYVKDLATPALVVGELKREVAPGRVGLSVGNFSPAYFSNFRFTATSRPPLKGKVKEAEAAPAGAVKSWKVSAPFEEKALDGRFQLTPADKTPLTWTTLASENGGMANLARLHGLRDGKNTVFARLTIRSEAEQVKRLRFGFSDSVKVYFNDRLIYGGTDVYRSRDYRFLGTIGLYDELYLPLKAGENEVWMAVTEDFGGWGVKAQFDDLDGISVGE
jgi:hypothetical protein